MEVICSLDIIVDVELVVLFVVGVLVVVVVLEVLELVVDMALVIKVFHLSLIKSFDGSVVSKLGTFKGFEISAL